MEESFKVTELSGQNYFTWAHRAKAILSAKKLWQYVISEEEATPIATVHDEQATTTNEQNKALAYAYLVNLIDDKILSSFLKYESAFSLWHALEKTYSKVGETDVARLTKRLFDTNMGEDLDVEAYISDLQKIFCRLAGAGCPMSEESKFNALLSGLPETFDSFANAAEILEQSHKEFEFLASKLRNAVIRLKTKGEKENLMVAQVKSPEMHCDICNKNNHTTW